MGFIDGIKYRFSSLRKTYLPTSRLSDQSAPTPPTQRFNAWAVRWVAGHSRAVSTSGKATCLHFPWDA